jgi:hypothetical protein
VAAVEEGVAGEGEEGAGGMMARIVWVCKLCEQPEWRVKKGQCGAIFGKCDTAKPKKKIRTR